MHSRRLALLASLTLCTAALPAIASAQRAVFTVGSGNSTAAPTPQLLDLVATLDKSGNYTMLAKLLMQANLASTLQGSAQFTIFAPTDEAFAKIPKATLDSIASDSLMLKHLLLFHVVNGTITSNQILKLKNARTMQGSKIDFKMENGRLHVDKAIVVQPDIKASNGVIHGIESVIMPEKL